MTDDPTPIRWDGVALYCPICIQNFDWGEEDYPPILEVVGETDLTVETQDIFLDDGVDQELFEQWNEVEPQMWCRECDSLFDIDLVPRPSSSDAARRLASSRRQTRRMFERADEPTDAEKASVYRRWRRGEVSDSEAKEFFSDDEWETVEKMARNDEIVEETPDASASDDDLFFEGQQEESSVVLVADRDAMRIAEILREVDDDEEAEYWAKLLEEHAADHAVPSHIDGEHVGEVIEELADRQKLLDVIEQTPNLEPPDDLITDEE